MKPLRDSLLLIFPLAGGFEHVTHLVGLKVLNIPGFWAAFDPLPEALARMSDDALIVNIMVVFFF